MDNNTWYYMLFLICSNLSIQIYNNNSDITWMFLMFYFMQILVMPRMLLIDMRADTHIRVQNITMLILMSFVNDFNIKYIIRLVSWIYTTPVLLNNVLQNNKKCLHIIFLHELAYMIELMIVIFKMHIIKF